MVGLLRKLKFSKNVDHEWFLLFQRLLRIYHTFNVFSTLVAALSMAVLTFDEFHPAQLNLLRAAEGLFCSSAISAVTSVMLATMLLFKFEGIESATRLEFALAWTPLVILDLSILEYLFGLLLWYSGKNKSSWGTALLSSQLAILLGYTICVAIWMWKTMYPDGGLRRKEAQVATEIKRTADK